MPCNNATSKDAELSCEVGHVISFWSRILSWKYPHFLEISTFVDIIRISWNDPCFMDIIRVSCINPYFVDIIRISWKYPRSVDIIRISSIISLTFYPSSASDWCTFAGKSLVLSFHVSKIRCIVFVDLKFVIHFPTYKIHVTCFVKKLLFISIIITIFIPKIYYLFVIMQPFLFIYLNYF